MSNETERSNVHFDTRIQFYGPVIILAGGIFSLVSLVVLIVFASTHWISFVAMSTWIVYSVLVLLGVLALAGVCWLGIHLYRKAIEAYGQGMRNKILHTSDHYAIVEINGRAEVIPVSQEKYSYNIRQDERRQDETIVIDAADEPDALPAPVETFSALLQAGTIQETIRQGKMLLGFTDGILRYGSWLDLYSCAVGGVSGSGKTTTVRFLLFQGILAGARLVMIDPHINEPDESLAAQFSHFKSAHFFPPCDDSTPEVLRRVRWLKKQQNMRKSTGQKTPFLILVIDEFNAVMRNKQIRDELSELLVSMAQEGRKFGLFAMLIGQRWAQQDIGGADIRTSLASTLAHRFTDEGQAKLLIGGRAAGKCLELPQGHYWFRDTNGGLNEMITPYTDVNDGAIIQRLLDMRTSTEPGNGRAARTPETTLETSQKLDRKQGNLTLLPGSSGLARNHVETTGNEPETTPETTTETTPPLPARLIQVVQLQAQGMSKPEIMRAVWGVSPGGSQAYETANTEYQQVMKQIAEKLGA